MDKKFPCINGYSIKNILKPTMEEALKQCFDEFSYKNALHIIDDNNGIQKELEHTLKALLFSYVENPFYRSLIQFKILIVSSINNKTSLSFIPGNLFTLILIYLYEVPAANLLPNFGNEKNTERFDYKEHSFWFGENGEAIAVNINVDKCETSIKRFNL